MQTMHPTLLIGPADWDPGQMPRAEFDRRIAALWRANAQAVGAIVFGTSADHAALAYLTNFTPKLEAALALIPRDGAPQLLVGGGVNMIAAARPLTFVEQLAPLRDPGKAAVIWARTLPAGGPLILIGGDAMPFAMRRELDAALLAERTIDDGTVHLGKQMLSKAPAEVAALRAACAGLDRAVSALRAAHLSGAGVTQTLLVAEQTALRGGAQDVRSLFSTDGGRTLRPFDVPVAGVVDPLQVYIAVRHAGYWAEGFVRAARATDPLGEQANRVLRATIAAAKPGKSCRDLAQSAAAARGSWLTHPMTDAVFGNSIGLSLQEAPILARAGTAMLTAGAVYSLRAGLLDGDGAGAIASAMLRVTESGSETLWPTSEAS